MRFTLNVADDELFSFQWSKRENKKVNTLFSQLVFGRSKQFIRFKEKEEEEKTAPNSDHFGTHKYNVICYFIIREKSKHVFSLEREEIVK